ncbi:hypothetical protein [Tenacibaculum sp. 190524A05c]|uniref:hypothetical protein n=1 Tax=Tenacibaculum platacis TaxID=3137852 RepID=UPI0031FAD5B3
MKIKFGIIVLTILVFTLASCETSKNDTFDYGKIENNIYSNDYFNFNMKLPEGWSILSKEAMKESADRGADLISGDNEELKSVLNASKVKTAYLLNAFKYEVGKSVDYNPGFIVVSENLKFFTGIKTGADYYYHVKKLLEKSKLNFNVEENITTVNIGGESFDKMCLSINHLNLNVKQEYYTTIKEGFALGFIISFVNNSQRDELLEIINSLEFKS